MVQETKSTTITFLSSHQNEIIEEKQNYSENAVSRASSDTVDGGETTAKKRHNLKTLLMRKVNLVRKSSSATISNSVEGPPYHTMKIETVADLMKTDVINGLKDREVEEKHLEYGYNEMEGDGGVNPIKLMLKQFFNVMVLILVIAMVVSIVFKDWVEAGVIAFIMVLNAGIGFAQEYKAERTMESLRQMASPTAQVIRNGQQKTVPTRDLVPGDIIILKNGDVVGADCRIIESFNMDIDEALLTGESLPVNKVSHILDTAEVPLGDRINMTYSSTTLCKGRGKAIVTAIGMQTEIGKIAKRLLDSDDNARTPLQKSLDRMALTLLVVAIISLLIVFAVVKFDIDDQTVLYGISTAIAVIPEGLIAVVTLTQAFGVNAMAKANALVRRLVALENLGAVTNVCSDKTGTLTQSKMVLTRFWKPDTGFHKVSGLGFQIEGVATEESTQTVLSTDNLNDGMSKMIHVAALCNMSEVRQNPETEEWYGIGDPTEIALQVFAHKMKKGKPSLTSPMKGEAQWTLISEFPFDSSIKRMSVICEKKESDATSYVAFLKGATERILDCCSAMQMGDKIVEMSQSDLESRILPSVENLAAGGLRVLSLAYKKIDSSNTPTVTATTFAREQIERDMVFVGLVGIYDPPRQESRGAVEKCHLAGITVHMLTGDHIATATAIAREVGILPADGNVGNLVMSAQAFDKLSEDQIDALPELPLVIARCSPDTKVKMIEALHRRKKIAAMTGDGVNDSPSLKESDIGISMGQGGSDVAKQASDIILVDDNFATIVAAIEEGRRVFANISKFCVHMISVNVAELTPLLLCLALKNGSTITFPLSPIQILFNNLITSAPPAMALGLEAVDPDQMRVSPRTDKESLFCKKNIIDILYYGVMMGLICMANYAIVIYGYGDGTFGDDCNKNYNDSCEIVYRARGALFVTMTVLLLLHAHTCRDLRNPTWTIKGLTSNPNYYMFWSWLFGFAIMFIVLYIPNLNVKVFKHLPIEWEWGMVAASIVVYVILAEGWKLLSRKIRARF